MLKPVRYLIAALLMGLCPPALADGMRGAHPFLKNFYQIEVYAPPRLTDSYAFRNEWPDDPPVQITTARGHWLILNIWATWCAPCLYELPFLDALQAKSTAIAVWAVSVDQSLDPRVLTATRKRFALDHLAILHDTTGQLTKMLDTTKLPATLIIDPDGNLHATLYGQADWSSDRGADFVQALPKLWPPPPVYVKQDAAESQ